MRFLALGIGGSLLVTFIGCMILTNPGQSDYEDYASEKLVFYLKDKICLEKGISLFLQRYCHTLVDTSRKQLGQFLSQKTQRHNYVFFSIYKTDLLFPAPIPRYQFETIGILENFYTYESDRV